MKAVHVKCKTDEMLSLDTISTVYFLQARFFTGKFLLTTIIHLDIFCRRALWADSVSLRMNTIASYDLFSPIKIGENLVVNYKSPGFQQLKVLFFVIHKVNISQRAPYLV